MIPVNTGVLLKICRKKEQHHATIVVPEKIAMGWRGSGRVWGSKR